MENSPDDHLEPEYFDEVDSHISPFIEILLENGTKKTIRKSTYLWTITGPVKHLSNDRLKRVQEAKDARKPKKARRQLVSKKEISPNQSEPILTLCKNDSLMIGDWCVFETKKQNKNAFVLGNIVYLKDRQYSWEFAPIKAPENVKKPRGIEVLASWFEIGSITTLVPIKNVNSFYINIDKYIVSLSSVQIKSIPESGCLSLTDDQAVLKALEIQLTRLRESVS